MRTQLPGAEEMYDAIVRRDASYEGVFFTAVTTTGIFCRPACPARKPRREHVEFFASAGQALRAGYRRCKRCRPLETASAPLVQRQVSALDAEPGLKWTAAELAGRGIDPDTARRQFRRHFGLTFAGYVRARRMGESLATLRGGQRAIDAQLDAGFESASGFRDAFQRLFGTPPRDARSSVALRAAWLDTPLGAMLAIGDETALHLLEFVDRRGLGRAIERLRTRCGAVVLPGRTAPLAGLEAELQDYFAGRELVLRTPVTRHGSAFQQAAWDALAAIPPGQTRSYADIAAAIGRPDAVRAVARANGANTLALLVPCHRVIGADGKLTGYGGGRWRKRWLIDHERRVTGAGHGARWPGHGDRGVTSAFPAA